MHLVLKPPCPMTTPHDRHDGCPQRPKSSSCFSAGIASKAMSRNHEMIYDPVNLIFARSLRTIRALISVKKYHFRSVVQRAGGAIPLRAAVGTGINVYICIYNLLLASRGDLGGRENKKKTKPVARRSNQKRNVNKSKIN